jgi:importin-7
MAEDVDEREKDHWWKSKKWSYANLNRLFVRYGNPASLSKTQDKEYGDYPKLFLSTFAPEILNGYLREIEKWVRGDYWLSKPALSFTLVFLEESVKPKTMWENLKPHMDGLISHPPLFR